MFLKRQKNIMEAQLSQNLNVFSLSTKNIWVEVRPEYLDGHSDPEARQFVWAYHVAITNSRNDTIQILSRHWKIADSNGESQQIVGDGLVGQKPTLSPGDSFDYSSGTPLRSPSGFMSGFFHAITEKQERFNIIVPAFALDRIIISQKLH